MVVTWYIETLPDHKIQAYYDRLWQAKYDLLKLFRAGKARIVKLEGRHKYEGVRVYALIYQYTEQQITQRVTKLPAAHSPERRS